MSLLKEADFTPTGVRGWTARKQETPTWEVSALLFLECHRGAVPVGVAVE